MTGRLILTRAQRLILLGYLVVCVVHLVTQLADQSLAARITQALAMPLLAAVLLAGSPGRGRLLPLVLVALFFSWLGDLLPALVPDAFSFLALIGAFLVSQVIYAAAFWPYRDRSLARTPWVLGYVLFVAAIVIVCLPRADVLLPGVILYAAAIGAMAVLASGVHPLALVGGLLFLVSDALIALNVFVPSFSLSGQGFWVMLTYLGAQLLLVLGSQAASDDEEATEDAVEQGSSNPPARPT